MAKIIYSHHMSTSIYGIKYRVTRVYPCDNGKNAVSFTDIAKYKVDSIDEFIEKELYVQRHVFKGMGCDENEIRVALAALEKCYRASSCAKSPVSPKENKPIKEVDTLTADQIKLSTTTAATLKTFLKEKGITYKSSANKAALVALALEALGDDKDS